MSTKMSIKGILLYNSLHFVLNVYNGLCMSNDLITTVHVNIKEVRNPKQLTCILPTPEVTNIVYSEYGELATVYCYSIPVCKQVNYQLPDVEVDLKEQRAYMSMLDKDCGKVVLVVISFNTDLCISKYFETSNFSCTSSKCLHDAELLYESYLQKLHLEENDWDYEEKD